MQLIWADPQQWSINVTLAAGENFGAPPNQFVGPRQFPASATSIEPDPNYTWIVNNIGLDQVAPYVPPLQAGVEGE